MPLRGDRLRWPPRPGKKLSDATTQGTRGSLSTDDKLSGAGQPLQQPNERDESADAHSSAPRPVIKRAHDDLAQGQQDTDCRNQSAQVIDGASQNSGKAGGGK